MISDFDPIAFTPNRATAADREHWYWRDETHPILGFWLDTIRGSLSFEHHADLDLEISRRHETLLRGGLDWHRQV